MFQINKNEPTYFTQVKSKVKNPKTSQVWSDNSIEKIRFILRSHILSSEQNLLCAYCEKEINSKPNNSNIDHYKTRALFPEKTLDYNNLLVSCNSKFSCSNIKDNFRLKKEDYQNIINPILENPDDYFEYGFAGDIIAKQNLSETDKQKAEFTIKVFALDYKSLTDERKIISYALETYKRQGYDVKEIFSYLTSHKSFITYIYDRYDTEEENARR